MEPSSPPPADQSADATLRLFASPIPKTLDDTDDLIFDTSVTGEPSASDFCSATPLTAHNNHTHHDNEDDDAFLLTTAGERKRRSRHNSKKAKDEDGLMNGNDEDLYELDEEDDDDADLNGHSVIQLRRAVAFYRRESENKQKELEHVTMTGHTLLQKLRLLTDQLNRRDQEEATERDNVTKEILGLVESLKGAQQTLSDQHAELTAARQANASMKIKLASLGVSTKEWDTGATTSGAEDDHQEKEGGSMVKEVPTKPQITDLKSTWEDELKLLNDKLQSAEELIKHQTDRFNKRLPAESDAEDESVDVSAKREGEEDFDFRLRIMPREFLERQVRRYRESADNERASADELKEEKMDLEEEIMQLKLQLGEKDLEIGTLQSGKEALEMYVADLAEEMENETSQMATMKDFFFVESKRMSETTDIILNTPSIAKSAALELVSASIDMGHMSPTPVTPPTRRNELLNLDLTHSFDWNSMNASYNEIDDDSDEGESDSLVSREPTTGSLAEFVDNDDSVTKTSDSLSLNDVSTDSVVKSNSNSNNSENKEKAEREKRLSKFKDEIKWRTNQIEKGKGRGPEQKALEAETETETEKETPTEYPKTPEKTPRAEEAPAESPAVPEAADNSSSSVQRLLSEVDVIDLLSFVFVPFT
eukprot:TRINITY_DN2131_c0_g1_i1.p1 TRINITY_DN2131_c0_g1~~TRINITY_DN2131_c0_g1_i1.p1  ORF type:complete len:651 (+),score=180.08 TRINITY_DN2131_c0_g1_i1:154-2106(+)